MEEQIIFRLAYAGINCWVYILMVILSYHVYTVLHVSPIPPPEPPIRIPHPHSLEIMLTRK